ncbi:MAG: CDP-archaeol synthase [Clostridia bacterium]|nr:CDP-archaeol synthase [Clostridia bacterium]
MKQRIITGAAIALLMIAIFLLSGTVVYPIIMTLLCMIGTWEMLGCIRQRGNKLLTIPAMIASVASPLASCFYGYGSVLVIVMLYITVLLSESVFFDEKVKIINVSEVFMTTLYVVLCFSALLRLRYIQTGAEYIYLLVFIAAWVTDTFAYFTGFLFGKHKLIPKISPKKTVEGAIGGVIFCVIAFIVYGIIVGNVTDARMNIFVLAVVGFFMSVVSMVGDLIASSIKRTYGIKDYSNLFPGHGGVLDRFDSIMILSPLLLFVVENVRLFN